MFFVVLCGFYNVIVYMLEIIVVIFNGFYYIYYWVFVGGVGSVVFKYRVVV